MPVNFGNQKIKDIYFGNQKIKEVYFGNQLVYTSQSETYAVIGIGRMTGVVNAYDANITRTIAPDFSGNRFRYGGATTVGNFSLFGVVNLSVASVAQGNVVNAYNKDLVQSIPSPLSANSDENAVARTIGNFAIFLFRRFSTEGNAYNTNLVRSNVDVSNFSGFGTRKASANIGNFALFVINRNRNDGQGPIVAYNANLVRTIGPQIANNFSINPTGTNNDNYAIFMLGATSANAGNMRLVDAWNSNLVRTVAPNATNNARNGNATRVGNFAVFSLGNGNNVVNAYNNNLVQTVATSLRGNSLFTGAGTTISNIGLFPVGRSGTSNTAWVDTYDVNLVRGAATDLSTTTESGRGTAV